MLACWAIVNGPGSVIFVARSVWERRNSISGTSTGPRQRIGPTTRGTVRGSPPLVWIVAGLSESMPSSAVANRFE